MHGVLAASHTRRRVHVQHSGPLPCSKHPHKDAEIFTYIVEGQLSHEDSMGNKEALPRGCVQYLSAGTGITHSVRLLTPVSACM